MDKEKFKIASSINFEIHQLKKGLKSLEGSRWDKEVIIEVRKDYSDRVETYMLEPLLKKKLVVESVMLFAL